MVGSRNGLLGGLLLGVVFLLVDLIGLLHRLLLLLHGLLRLILLRLDLRGALLSVVVIVATAD